MAEEAVETTETEAPANDPAPTEAPAQESQSSGSPIDPEQFQLMQQRLERIDERLAPKEEEEAAPLDGLSLADRLLNAHYGEEEEGEEYEYEDEAAQQEGEPDPVAQELQAIKNYLNKQEYDRRIGELKSLSETYPELQTDEMQQRIAAELAPDIDQFGEQILTNPRHIKRALLAIKAETASAQETPAEAARNRGASLESDAGARAEDGAADYQSQAQREIVEAGGPSSVF
jgi:hypothetical protein